MSAEARELTEQDAPFVYHAMAGEKPDFHALAELAPPSGLPSPYGDPLSGRLAEVVGIHFLPDANPEGVRGTLEERFGPPLVESGGRLIWIGRDPEGGAWEGLVEVYAEFARAAQGGPWRRAGVLLAVTLRRHLPAQGGA